MAPYLSKNYRYPKKSRLQTMREAGLFVGFSLLAIMLVLFVLGWVSYAFQAQAASSSNNYFNQQVKVNFLENCTDGIGRDQNKITEISQIILKT